MVMIPPIRRFIGINISPRNKGFSGKMIGKGLTAGPNTSSTKPRSRIKRPTVTMTIEKTDSPISFVRKIRSIAYPTSPARTSERGIDNQRLSPACIVVNQTMNPPMITSSPCAKLNTLLAR